MKYAVLLNPLAGCGGCAEKARRELPAYLNGELRYIDLTGIRDVYALISQLPAEETPVLCGGDGTINRFANALEGRIPEREILYFAAGSGNDFLRDTGKSAADGPFALNPYLKKLPCVRVGDRTWRFVNSVGFGIDGYCCEKGDEARQKGRIKINYALFAIKGLLGAFHPVTAEVEADGQKSVYPNTWLAPCMKGRYYGGGMMPAPRQDRFDPSGRVSVMAFFCRSRLKALTAFPDIFKGKLAEDPGICAVRQGRRIRVRFDRPCALQIDGETVKDVTQYEVFADD